MANHCLPQIHGEMLRLAKLDTNGVPLPGAGNLYVTDALVRLSLDTEVTEGDEIEVKNAKGQVCLAHTGDDSLKWGNIEIEICTHDPYLIDFLTMFAGDVLTDGDARGYAAPPIGPITGTGISMEVWAKRIDDGNLDVDYPYAWHVLPWVRKLRQGGPRVFENAASNPVFVGKAYENPHWSDGPLNDWPVASDRWHQWIETTTVPVAVCGVQALAAS